MSLSDWLKKEGVPALHGVDTRMITKLIRGVCVWKLSKDTFITLEVLIFARV